MDYTGNTNKSKEPLPEKNIEKVITGEVIQKPKSLGSRFKKIFLGGDLKSSVRYVGAEVLLPALRNLAYDMIAEGGKRVIFGESRYRGRRPTDYRSYGSRTTYSNPLNRDWRDPRDRPNLPDQPSRYRVNRRDASDYYVPTRDEAEHVVERLLDCIDKYEVVCLADLHGLLGLPTTPIENKWGWTYLNNIEIRQTRDGYLIELPPLEEV